MSLPLSGTVASTGLSPTESDKRARRTSRWLRILLVSAALAVPCFWQTRIQAGDLSSHAYNAWLSTLVEQGRTPGLFLATQYTNVLFDVALAWLMTIFGAGLAQRILVTLAVEIFVWGAFVLASAVTGRRPWFLMPCLAMLGYGWTFHVGFFNFYVSMGLCLWALAGLRGGTGVVRLAVIPLVGLAVLAHALPVAWAASVAAYAWIAQKNSRITALAAAFALAVLFALRMFLMARFPHDALLWRGMRLTGADQMCIYGPKYLLVSLLLLVLWAALFYQLADKKGFLHVITGIPFQVVFLTAAGVVLIPTTIDFPGYRHSLVYIPDRMSLATAVSMCVLLSGANPPRASKAGITALAAVHFSFLYADARALNRIEDGFEALASTVAPGQRVVNGVNARYSRIDPLCHMIDRACIGRCFSYGNYEPSTGQFRLRAEPGNAFVVADYGDSFALQSGAYVVKQRDLPLYEVICTGTPEPCLRSLKEGEKTKHIAVDW
jgi:hypothetical protein